MKRYSTKLRVLRPIIHGIIIMAVFYLIYQVRLFTDLIPGIQLQIPTINYGETMGYAILAAIAFIAIGIIKELYELNKPIQNYFQTFTKVWIYWIITITFIAYFGQWFIFLFWISRFIIVVGAFVWFFALFFFDQIRNYIEARKHRESGNKILIVWSDTLESYKAIEKIKNGFSFQTEYVSINELWDTNFNNYFIVVAVGSFPKKDLQSMFERIRFSHTRFYHISEWFFLEDVVYAPENIDNIIALEYKHSTLDGRSIVLKRVFDFVWSFILIILSSPLLLLLAILIKIDSPGPAIYKSKRVGKYGRLFTFFKFRSMYTHLSVGYGGKQAEKLYQKLINSDANVREGVLPKIENDPRVTRMGKFIRKTSLDELPQLFCVLRWSMSLIWPRPHLPNEVKKYESRQKRLFSIKPWITGYAQVFGRDGLDFEEEAKLDLYYIQNRNIFMDFYIVFATLGVVFKWK